MKQCRKFSKVKFKQKKQQRKDKGSLLSPASLQILTHVAYYIFHNSVITYYMC